MHSPLGRDMGNRVVERSGTLGLWTSILVYAQSPGGGEIWIHVTKRPKYFILFSFVF